MARLNPNPSFGKPSGKIGDLVYVHYRDGRVVIRRRPQPAKTCSPAKHASQDRFRRAMSYVRGLRQNPALLALYKAAARVNRKRSCDLAVADFLTPPTLLDVDLSSYSGAPGQCIRIQAADDFAVAAVQVVIRTLPGEVVEEGPAAVATEDATRWLYETKATVPSDQAVIVEVAVSDHPGNRVTNAFAKTSPRS